MNALVLFSLVGWIPLTVFLCAILPPRTAILTSYVGAMLFLPVVRFPDPGMHHMTKASATDLGLIFGCMLFHSGVIKRFRLRWFDLPILLWCFCPVATSVANNLGVQEGLVECVESLSLWGVPYLIGRIYFSGLLGMRQLLTALFIGGVIYIPFCWWEIRLSPQLHRMLYGYYQHSFAQTVRFGGFRPMVFMDHGLMLGMWMSMATVAGATLWWTGVRDRLFGVHIRWLLGALLVTSVACKSLGSLVLMAVGIFVLYISWTFRSRLIIAILACVAPLYIYARVGGNADVQGLISAAQNFSTEDRGNSLRFRVTNEQMLMAKAMERPWFGWGGFDRSSVQDEFGKVLTISDSLWIVTIGMHGIFGLVTVTLAQLLPALVYLYRPSSLPWRSKLRAPALALSTIILLFSIDNTLNAMINPIFIIAAGAVAGCRPLRVKRVTVEVIPHPGDFEAGEFEAAEMEPQDDEFIGSFASVS